MSPNGPRRHRPVGIASGAATRHAPANGEAIVTPEGFPQTLRAVMIAASAIHARLAWQTSHRSWTPTGGGTGKESPRRNLDVAYAFIRWSGLLGWLLLLLGASPAAAQDIEARDRTPQPVTYAILERASLLQVHTYKAGLLGGLGHEHDVRAHGYAGTVVYDPGDPSRSRVSLTVPTDSLVVVIASDSSDIPAITRTMRQQVLRVDRFPEITFTSREVAIHDSTVRLRGDLTMVGVTRPVEMELGLWVTPDILHVRGSFTVKQTDFGIEPYATGLGTVKVKDEVTFMLDIRAVAQR